MTLHLGRERVHFNLARIKSAGETFEVDVDPDLALDFRQGRLSDIRQVLKAERVFKDAHKGLAASEHELERVFGTPDVLEVAAQIIRKGEVQLSAEHREKAREQKKRQIVEFIHRNAVDPSTHLPHPCQRIEAAMSDAKVRIDDFKPAEAQFDDVVAQLRPVLPLKFEVKLLQVSIPAEFAAKSYSLVKAAARIVSEEWRPDGSWSVRVELAAGLEQDFYDKVNKFTHGNNEISVVEVK